MITLTVSRRLIIANYRLNGPRAALLAPWRVKPVLDDNDETGIVLQPGTRVEVRDVSLSNCRDERGPEVICRPQDSIVWVRVGVRPQ